MYTKAANQGRFHTYSQSHVCFKQGLLLSIVLTVVATQPGYSSTTSPSPTHIRNTPDSYRPYKEVNSHNLLRNPELNGKRDWQLNGGAQFDENVTRTNDSSGSIKLTNPIPTGSMLRSNLMKVSAGKQYTFSYFMKTSNGPTYAGAQISIYRSDGSYIRNLPSTRTGTSADDQWEEVVLPVIIPEETAFVRVEAYKQENTTQPGVVWVDDLFFGEKLVLREKPETKKAFNGKHVRVDALGNFEVKRSQTWTPFFPLAIYSSNHRDWSLYSEQGWNTLIWTSTADEVEKAQRATSEFNPDGMMAGVMITHYIHPKGRHFGDLEELERHIKGIYDRTLQERLLLYYWDNENHHSQWQLSKDVIDTIRDMEIKMTGDVQHPVYALQGSFNVARVHAQSGLVDVSGTYYSAKVTHSTETLNEHVIATPLVVLDRLHKQSTPGAFAQFNDVQGAGEFRLRTYNAIIAGAKAIGYWRDCIRADCQSEFPEVGPVDKKAWSADIPLLRQEIDLLLPVIREQHWTEWQPVHSSESLIHVGTRNFNGHRVLILVNQSTNTERIRLTLPGVWQKEMSVIDYFSGQPAGNVSDNQLDIDIEGIGVGSGTRVLLVD